MNVISIILGVIAALILVVAIFPLLGWLNWLVVVVCIAGIVCGAVSKHKSGLIVNGAVLVVSLLRLFLGGGIV